MATTVCWLPPGDATVTRREAEYTFGTIPKPRAVNVHCDEETLWIEADDGREISVPIASFPLLANATPEQRRHVRLIGGGIGIHWPDVNEDISVARLFGSPTD